MAKRALVIGSGIAGIAAAIRLRVKGYEVTVFEKNSYPGGKLTVVEGNGFRFDAGPSVFTLPELVTELFELAGKNYKEYFDYRRHPISAHYFWNDGTIFRAPGYKDAFVQAAHQAFDVSAEKIDRYLSNSERKYRITRPVFLEKSLHAMRNYFSGLYLRSYPKLLGLDLLKSLHTTNKKAVGNEKLVNVLDKFACYNGSSPYQTSGIMTLMPHLEITLGTYFPVGGMHAITNSLVRLSHDLGIEFRYNEQVERILTTGKRATGIRTNGVDHSGDVVICNSDVYFAHKYLLQTRKAPKAVSHERSSSVVVFYWGIQDQFPQLDLHNLFYPDDYAGEFDALFSSKTVFEEPSIYIHRSCHIEKADAPEGCENWFVMLMVPSEPSLIDSNCIEQLRTFTISKLDRVLKTDLRSRIVFEDVLDPLKIEQRTHSYKGALHGTSSNSIFSTFLRHSNFSKSYKNLFFVGGSSHPGGGIPLCLLSAKIATEHA